MRRRVFIIQNDGTKNFSKARRFGEFRTILKRGVFPDELDGRLADMISFIRAILRDFDPGKDYVLLNGDPVSIALVSAHLFSRFPDSVIRLLKWFPEEKGYLCVEVSSWCIK